MASLQTSCAPSNSSTATADRRSQQATDLRAQIKEQSDEIQADSIVELQAKFDSANAVRQARTAAHTEGLQQGAGIGVGATLLLFGLVFGIRRLIRTSPGLGNSKARAASA